MGRYCRKWADLKIDELAKEFDSLSGLISTCYRLLTVIPPDDPDAIATLANLRRLRVKRDDIQAELMRLGEARQRVVRYGTH